MRIALSHSGENLVAGSSKLSWWDLNYPDSPVQTFQAEQALFSGDDSTLVLLPSRGEKVVQIWDAATRSLRTKIEIGASMGFTHSAAISADGSLLAMPTDPNNANNAIQLWDTHSGDLLGACHGHKQGIFAVTFTPDGKTLASASHDKTLRLWNVTTRQELLSIRVLEGNLSKLVFSPDGQWLAASAISNPFSSSGTLRLFHAPLN